MGTRIRSLPYPRLRRLLGLPVAFALVAGLATLAMPTAGAVLDTGFELDGNIAHVGAPATTVDWEDFFAGPNGARITPLPDHFVDSAFEDDYGPDTTTFTSGSKDTLDTSGWSCAKSNNLGGKVDIVNAYSTIYSSGSDLILHFGIERAATEGSGTMGFWFLKDPSIGCAQTGSGKAPSFSGHHSDGDIFVTAEFSSSGAQVQAYMWVGGANGHLNTTAFVTGAECVPGGTGSACGIVNPEALTPPWTAPDKNGGALDANAFYEGAVTVPAGDGCFANFVANTRSSTSPTATIFDYARGQFPTCRPSTSMTASVDAKVTFYETNDGNVALDKPGDGAFVRLSGTAQCTSSLVQVFKAAPGDTTKNIGDTNNNTKLDPAETWRWECTVLLGSGTTPVASGSSISRATGHGIDPTDADVTICGLTADPPATLPGTTTPASPRCDPEEQRTVTITVG